jgi:hypothetical protein
VKEKWSWWSLWVVSYTGDVEDSLSNSGCFLKYLLFKNILK